jgi:leucyl aminopeptidase
MDVMVRREPLKDVAADALVIPAFEDKTAEPTGAPVDALVKELLDAGEFSGKAGEFVLLHRPDGLAAKRLLVVGAGKPDKFTPAELRKAASCAVRALKSKGLQNVAMVLPQAHRGSEFAEAAAEGAILALFEPDRHQTKDNDNPEKPMLSFAVAVPGGDAHLDAAVARGQVIAESQNVAREVANEPGNLLTPMKLAQRAREVAAESGLECEVLEQDKMRELGMGALLGVAQGSAEPPALIIIKYRPAAVADGAPNLALVGKGVTFDTGGISIKPADGMEKMKYDMCGAAAVIGAMRAIARLKPSIPVTGIIPTVENMPGSKAQRPGDIVTSLSGKTVEVLNTDAEGRLILADAITYAERLGCTHLIDAATLTGAIVVALGAVRVGAFTNDDDFLKRVLASAERQGEKMWPMPLDEEYREQLKSPFADIQNIGTRWGGAITAARFIREFVSEGRPWVHLDIAGTAWMDDAKPWSPKGPTGVAVRTFIDVAMTWEK